jgi:riboflavin kinase / FMN adenylyltransferase
MQRYTFSLGTIPPLGYKTTLCLGTFDGFHRGHQSLLFAARKKAEGDVAVLLFDQNPSLFFSSNKSEKVLTSLDDKSRLLESKGCDILYVIHVDKAFFQLSPEDFIAEVLKPLEPSLLVMGSDYTFGAGGKGTPELLAHSFATEVVPLLNENGSKISTQSLIKEIEAGQVAEAEKELGRPYQIVGKVVHGYENGRTIGFPTANLLLAAPYVLPKNGVYMGLCYVRGLPYKALINVGVNPTVGLLKEPVVECYLKGLDEDIYGETLYCEFLLHIRDEITFPNLDGVKEQIKKDLKYLG